MKIHLETPEQIVDSRNTDKVGLVFDTEFVVVNMNIDPITMCGVFVVAPKNQGPSIEGKRAMLSTLYSALGNAIDRFSIVGPD